MTAAFPDHNPATLVTHLVMVVGVLLLVAFVIREDVGWRLRAWLRTNGRLRRDLTNEMHVNLDLAEENEHLRQNCRVLRARAEELAEARDVDVFDWRDQPDPH
jgi:hypothetical protein